MATKKFYIGSLGPFLYEDDDLVSDPDGDFSGAFFKALLGDGELQCQTVITEILKLRDTDDSHSLTVIWNENDTSDRTLNLLVVGGDRSVTVEADSVISQDYSVDASPQFANLNLTTGELTCGSINRAADTLTLEIGGVAQVSIATTGITITPTLILSTCIDAGADVDKFLVLDTGNRVDYRTGAEVLSDIGAATAAHLHDGDTIECDGIASDGGAFSFVTSGDLTIDCDDADETTVYIKNTTDECGLDVQGNLVCGGSITGTGLDIGTGQVDCGVINRAADVLELRITGSAILSLSSTAVVASVKIDTAEIEHTGNITIDAINAGDDSTVYFTNSGAGGNCYVNVSGQIDVGEDAVVVGSVQCDFLKLHDSNDSHLLSIYWNEDDSAHRVLNLLVGGGSRSLTLNEDFVIGDGFAGTLTFAAGSKTLTVEDDTYLNQDLTTDATPSWAGAKISSCVNAGVDTDKFLVLDAGNNIDYRTGAEVLSDIGAAAATHASAHEVGGADLVDHDNLTNFTANEHFLQSAITEVGTVATGTWEADAIAAAYIGAHASAHAVAGADTVFPADPNADKFLMWDDDPGELVWADAGGGAHKDTHDPEDGADPLDCAAPSELVGVQASGEGSAHEFARADHAHQIQHGIADNHLVTVDGASNSGEYARFTADGIVGRTEAEFKADFNLEDGDINALIVATKLDDLTAPDDNTDLDFSTAKHGLMSKAPNDTDKGMRGDATWVKLYATYKA